MIAVYAYYSLLVQSYSLQDSFVTDTTLMGKILLVTPMLRFLLSEFVFH